MPMDTHTFDIAVVGGGIVGCAILHELTNNGYNCVLLERNPHLATGASGGNSAILDVLSGLSVSGMEEPINPLERWCIQHGTPLLMEFCQRYDIPYKAVPGLMVAWSADEMQKLDEIKSSLSKPSQNKVRRVDREALLLLEPSLSQEAVGALLIDGVAVLDSCLLLITLAHQACRKGAKVVYDCEVTGGCQSPEGVWELKTSQGPVRTKIVINAAGLHGDEVEQVRGDVLFRIQPRKGQFVVYGKGAGQLLNHVIMQVPTEKGRGIHVYPSVYGNLVVGPTASDVQERRHPTIEDSVTKHLQKLGRTVIPDLQGHEVVGTYAGLRPATETADYHLYAYAGRNWVTACGIRSTGVTGCFGIAKYVLQMLLLFDVRVNKPSRGNLALPDTTATCWVTEKPSVVLDGTEYAISHPLMRIGLAGAAKPQAKL